MATPTGGVLDRLALVSKRLGVSEREMCEGAGIKSPSQLAAARSRGSSLNWDHLAGIVIFLAELRVRRDWLLWGDGKMTGDDVVHIGPGAGGITPPAVPTRQARSKAARSTDDAPAAPKHRRRA